MYRDTDRQAPLFGTDMVLSESARRRLEESWARPFAESVYPILLEVESDFADLYSSQTGRPVWSVARKLGICLLQEMHDLDDQRALDRLSFDIRWQYALGFGEDEDPYLSRRSLCEFRARLLEVDPEMTRIRRLFARIRDEAMDALGVDASMQRIDSALVESNIRRRGRLDLVTTTLMHFLKQLKAECPKRFETLSEELVSWVEAKDSRGWFTAPAGTGDQQENLEKLGGWLIELKLTFEGEEPVSSWESFEYAMRVLEEHFEWEDEPDPDPPPGGRATPDAPGRQAQVREHAVSQRDDGTTLQSPHDADAAKGLKGVGYMVHISETCHNENEKVSEILTDYHVEAANQADQDKSQVIIRSQNEEDIAPERLYADGGYLSATALKKAKELGVELNGPVSVATYDEDKMLGRADFEWTEQGRIEACPAGHKPIDHRKRTWRDKERYEYAFFDPKDCANCPLRDRCVTRNDGNQRILALVPRLLLRDAAIARQRHKEWWDDYQIRSGIEATISELKRAHGMRKLRVRGIERVKMKVGLKATACNIKRWLKAETAKPSPSLPSRRRRFLSVYTPVATRSRCDKGDRIRRPNRPRAIGSLPRRLISSTGGNLAA